MLEALIAQFLYYPDTRWITAPDVYGLTAEMSRYAWLIMFA
jgi:hypothetical protein